MSFCNDFILYHLVVWLSMDVSIETSMDYPISLGFAQAKIKNSKPSLVQNGTKLIQVPRTLGPG